MSNDWQVYKVINFDSSKRWEGPLSDDGYSLFGIHDREGRQCILAPNKDWVGCIRHGSNVLEWSAGIKPVKNSKLHISAGIKNPSYVAQVSDDYYILSNTGLNQILGLDLKNGKANVLIDLNKHGVDSPANCIVDREGNIWINSPGKNRLWQFSKEGDLIRAFGTDGEWQYSLECAYDHLVLSEIYDLKGGADGNIYFLEGKKFCLRMIDLSAKKVKVVAGNGKSGYTGDGGHPLSATFGSKKSGKSDGPWAFCIDEENNIYIGDTQNRVVRMLDRKSNTLQTIAGGVEYKAKARNNCAIRNPYELMLPSICWMDYCQGMLYITDMIGDLIVLAKS